MALERRVRALVDIDSLPVDVLRAKEREMDESRTDGVVGEAIDQDETAGIAVLECRVEKEDNRPGACVCVCTPLRAPIGAHGDIGRQSARDPCSVYIHLDATSTPFPWAPGLHDAVSSVASRSS
jgi:hypothetical protein